MCTSSCLRLIVLKLLNSAPTRLQWMLLKLQRYYLEVRYKKGKHNVHCWHSQPCSFGRHQHMWIFKRSGRGWPYLFNFSQERATTQDNAKVYRGSSVYGFSGDHHQWLARKKIKVLECGDELVTQDQLVPKGHCLVIPSAVRKEMMKWCMQLTSMHPMGIRKHVLATNVNWTETIHFQV